MAIAENLIFGKSLCVYRRSCTKYSGQGGSPKQSFAVYIAKRIG